MSISMLSTEPVVAGEVKSDNLLTSFIDGLKKNWDSFKAGLGSATKVSFVHVVKFLLFSLDGLIVFVDNLIPGGADKKATVLAAVGVLYDYIIKEALPLWLRPWAGGIKGFIIGTIMSIAIDWIVSKYREGSWKK